MNARLGTVLVIAAAVVFGAVGYFAGVRSSGPDEAEVGAFIESYLKSHPELLETESPTSGTSDQERLSEPQIAEVQQIIRDHLISNPEILSDASIALEQKRLEAELAARAAAITDDKDRIFDSTRQAVIGNPDGEVTLVEFFDYNCGFCKRAHADLLRLLEEDDNLRVVLKEFPVLSEGSVEAARVGVAINIAEPDKYFEFHDTLLMTPGRANSERAMAVAEDIGVDMAKLEETMASPEVEATITEVYDLAEKPAGDRNSQLRHG